MRHQPDPRGLSPLRRWRSRYNKDGAHGAICPKKFERTLAKAGLPVKRYPIAARMAEAASSGATQAQPGIWWRNQVNWRLA
jgi:hypothetical protein